MELMLISSDVYSKYNNTRYMRDVLCEVSSSSSLFPAWTIIPPLKHCRKQGGSLP